jgi:hypothetical protein
LQPIVKNIPDCSNLIYPPGFPDILQAGSLPDCVKQTGLILKLNGYNYLKRYLLFIAILWN